MRRCCPPPYCVACLTLHTSDGLANTFPPHGRHRRHMGAPHTWPRLPLFPILLLLGLFPLLVRGDAAGGGVSSLILCTSSLLGDRRHLENALELYQVLRDAGNDDILIGFGLYPSYLTSRTLPAGARTIQPSQLKPKNLKWMLREAFHGGNALMYLIGHGSNGNMLFQGRLVLSSRRLWTGLEWAHGEGLFDKMLLIIETCQAETMLSSFRLAGSKGGGDAPDWLSVVISSTGTQPSFALPPDRQAGIPLRSRFNVALCGEMSEAFELCRSGTKSVSVRELAESIDRNNIGSTVASRGETGMSLCDFISTDTGDSKRLADGER